MDVYLFYGLKQQKYREKETKKKEKKAKKRRKRHIKETHIQCGAIRSEQFENRQLS